MRLARIQTKTGSTVAITNASDCWYDLRELAKWAPELAIGTTLPLIEKPELLAIATKATAGASHLENSEFQFHCPLQSPEKIICIGKNYAEHAAEMGGDRPESPVVFSKFASTLIGPDQPIILPSISDCVDFEAELVVVIGKTCQFVSEQDASNYIFGYTIGNDVSARDWQKGRPGGQWLLGKTFDTFAPLGPYIVTANELTQDIELDIELQLNGKTMQSGNTSQMIFSIPYLVSHLSKFVTLRPGDLIFTGTPAGVGAGRKPPVFLKHGDKIEIAISQIGKLSNPVIAAR